MSRNDTANSPISLPGTIAESVGLDDDYFEMPAEELHRLETATDKVEEYQKLFIEIQENFDLTNTDHLERAKNFLSLCENKCYETTLNGSNPLEPHYRKVRFELKGTEVRCVVIQDLFGKSIPDSFQYFDESWIENGKKFKAKYSISKTIANNMVVYVHLVSADDTHISERTSTVGTISRFSNKIRILANESGAKKLFIQFDGMNERLESLLKRRHTFHGQYPIFSRTRGTRALPMYDIDYPASALEARYSTIEVDLREPVLTALPDELKQKYENDLREHAQLSDRLEATREGYLYQYREAFHEICDKFDLANADHVECAKQFLGLCENHEYETNIDGHDHTGPYCRKVLFKLEKSEVTCTVLQELYDLFGVPESFEHVNEEWIENGTSIRAEYSISKTNKNNLIIFINDLIADGAEYSQSTATSGTLIRFNNKMCALAKQENVTKLFVQFYPENKKLYALAKRRHQFFGHYPAFSRKKTQGRFELPLFEMGTIDPHSSYCTFEIDLLRPISVSAVENTATRLSVQRTIPEETGLDDDYFEMRSEDLAESEIFNAIQQYEIDLRKLKHSSDCLEYMRNRYIDQYCSDFYDIEEIFDLTNRKHTNCARKFLSLCENNTYETYLKGTDPLAPHYRKVRFELHDVEVRCVVVEDLFGKIIPETYESFDETFDYDGKKISLDYSISKTRSNNFVVFVDLVRLENADIGDRTKTIGMISHFTNKMRQLARKARAEKLFIQFLASNERLGILAEKRHPSHGKLPFLLGKNLKSIMLNKRIPQGDQLLRAGTYSTIEVDLKKPTQNQTSKNAVVATAPDAEPFVDVPDYSKVSYSKEHILAWQKAEYFNMRAESGFLAHELQHGQLSHAERQQASNRFDVLMEELPRFDAEVRKCNFEKPSYYFNEKYLEGKLYPETIIEASSTQKTSTTYNKAAANESSRIVGRAIGGFLASFIPGIAAEKVAQITAQILENAGASENTVDMSRAAVATSTAGLLAHKMRMGPYLYAAIVLAGQASHFVSKQEEGWLDHTLPIDHPRNASVKTLVGITQLIHDVFVYALSPLNGALSGISDWSTNRSDTRSLTRQVVEGMVNESSQTFYNAIPHAIKVAQSLGNLISEIPALGFIHSVHAKDASALQPVNSNHTIPITSEQLTRLISAVNQAYADHHPMHSKIEAAQQSLILQYRQLKVAEPMREFVVALHKAEARASEQMPNQTFTSTQESTMPTSESKSIANIITDFFASVYSDLKSMCDNPFLPKTDYEQAKIREVFRAHMQAAGPTFHLHAPHTSQNKGLSQLAHYLTSPKHFAEHAKLISQKTLAFIRSDHPDAAALTEQTLCRFQNEYLEKIQQYSETSPEKTLDYATQLLDKENIPENVRSIYYQQCLSALPIKDDLSIDLNQIKTNQLEVKTQLQHLEKQYAPHLQKNADQHHAQTSQSLHKIKEAVNGNTAAIHDLKVGQQQIIDYFNAQIIEAESVLKAQQKEQQHQQSIEGYQKFGQFLGMMGDATDVPILKDAGTVCMAGVMAYQAYTGFVALSTAATAAAAQATAAALASGATAASAAAAGTAAASGATSLGAALGPIAMAGMAALMVVSMLFKKESGAQSNEAHQQIMRALQQMLHQIMSKLDLIQEQMHKRFDRVDKRLDQIVELIYTGFDQVLLETKKIVGLHLQGLYAGEKLAAKVDAVASDMHASFEAIQDTLIKPIISGILKPSSADYLENLSISEFSTRKERLFFFLTGTSCSAAANGFHRIDDAGEVSIRHDAIAKTLRDQSIPKLSHLLGLLAGLANHHVGTAAIAAHPESLLNPTQWRPALVAYEKLLTECNPTLGLDKTSHSAEINELSKRLEQLKEFLQNVSINNPLFEALVKNYHDALSNIEKLIVAHLENQEMAYYKKACIPVQSGEHLLRLDETFDDAQKRQKSEEFLRLCQESPVRFSAKTPAENLNPEKHVEEYLFHADLKRPNGTQFDSVHEGRYKYGNDDYTLVLVTSFPEFMEPKKIYVRLKPTTIEYITNGLGKKAVIDRATLSHIYPVSPYDLAAVREDILFHAAINTKDNSVHALIDWDPAKLAFAHFKNHFSTFVKLSLSSSVLYKNYAPQLALLMKLNQLTLSKKYNADITDTGDGSGNDSQGRFTRVVNCTYAYTLSTTHGSQLGLLQGSENTQIRDYWIFFTPESVSYSPSEDLALYLGSFWVVSGADNWGAPSLNALPYDFIPKETQKIIKLMHPYRLQALDELQTDFRFTQALEKLESTALQLSAFMNLLQIDPSVYQAKMVRSSHVLSLLSESKMAVNPSDSIEKIKSLLCKLREKSLKKEDVLALTSTVNIKLNSLHVWAQESIDDLGELVLKINAWTDAPTQQTKDEAEYQRGLAIGNAFSLSAISSALFQAGFPDAARIVLGDQPASVLIVDEKELSASEKRGFLQAISGKVIEVVPLLAKAAQVPALVWLTTIFHQQNTRLLESSADVTSRQGQTRLNRNRFLGGATTSGLVTAIPKQENANHASLGSV